MFRTIHGAEQPKDAEWFLFDSTNSPLPHNSVFEVGFDSGGVVWAHTRFVGDTPIFGFDGSGWFPLDGIPKQQIIDIVVAPDGEVCFAGDLGIYRYHGESVRRTSIGGGQVYTVCYIKAGELLAGGQYGLFKVTGNVVSQLAVTMASPWTAVKDVTVAEDGSIWFCPSNHGVIRADDTSWVNYVTQNSDIAGYAVFVVTKAPDGALWIGTANGLTIVRDSLWTTYTAANSILPSDTVTIIEFDRGGVGWLGGSFGILRFDMQSPDCFDCSNSPLPCKGIYSIRFDGENRLWIGTSKGLFALSNAGSEIIAVGKADHVLSGATRGGALVCLGRHAPNHNTDNAPLIVNLLGRTYTRMRAGASSRGLHGHSRISSGYYVVLPEHF